jgi:c-di-GMP-binding flagellar brake protein YcgR
MSICNILALYPLQVSATDLQWRESGSVENPAALIVFVVAAVLIIGSLIIANAAKGGSGGGGRTSSGGGGFRSFLAMQRLVRNIGLNSDQARMLNFVFKTDDVIEPEKSISNPALLDRHFRRAYRVIETSSKSDEEAQSRYAVLFSTRNMLENSSVGTISSTRQLREDTNLTITYGREKIKVNVVNAKTENLTTAMPKNVLGTQIKIPKGTRVSVLFFTKSNKGFSFESRITGYSTMHGHPVLQIAHSNQLRFLSHRRFRRRHAVIACFMFLVYVDGNGKKQRLVVDKRRLTGNIADISVGGCSIKTSSPVKVGARFKIEFAQGENNVAALGQVLRINKTGISTVIHIKFLRLSKKSMNLINAFVYEYD